MWLVPTPDGEVDLEGALVLGVARSPGRISIEVENATLISDGAGSVVARASLICEGVRAERAAFYVGEGVQGEVKDHEVPLDDIEVVEFSGSTLELHGYKSHKPWYVWSIECGSVHFASKGARSAP